jgi:heme/copper-type cytochrome/quinol oxidase subunit 2
MMTGNNKWLMLAVALVVIAVINYFVGFYRKSKIEKAQTDIPEEEAGNKLHARKIYVGHTVVTFAFLIIAIVIYFVTKGAGV